MNWTHLISQVEIFIIDSQATPEEFKEILDASDWYKHEAWRTRTWWFGRGTTMAEVTFDGIRALWEWMGLDVEVWMGSMQYHLAEMVDELIVTEEEEVIDREEAA